MQEDWGQGRDAGSGEKLLRAQTSCMRLLRDEDMEEGEK